MRERGKARYFSGSPAPTPAQHVPRHAPTRPAAVRPRLLPRPRTGLERASATAWSANWPNATSARPPRRRSSALLAGEPDPTLAGVATWADTLRNNDPERFKQTSRWHYVNTPPAPAPTQPARDCPDGNCVVGAIEQQRAILADRRQPLAARRDALKFLVHFVGDVHQPMHANNRADKGGNDFQVSLRTDLEPEAYARNRYVNGVMGTNLHSVWDYYILGERSGLGPARTTPTASMRCRGRRWSPPTTGPMAWAGESCRLVDARHAVSGRAHDGPQLPRRGAPAGRATRAPGGVSAGAAARRHAGTRGT